MGGGGGEEEEEEGEGRGNDRVIPKIVANELSPTYLLQHVGSLVGFFEIFRKVGRFPFFLRC